MREKAKLSVRSKKWALRWLSIGIILILISCVGASVLQTNFYKTQVYTFKVPTSGGKYQDSASNTTSNRCIGLSCPLS